MKTLTKAVLTIVFVAIQFACVQKSVEVNSTDQGTQPNAAVIQNEKKEINTLLDSFNDAAAKAEFDRYFGYFAEDSIFIGTDATENWSKQAFQVWAKPYFDKKKTWDFTSLERNIFFDETGNVAWFDELLNTQMKIARGSGVLKKHGKVWKIQQYVLSLTIPNDHVDAVVKIKAPIEDALIKKLTGK